MNLSEDNNGVLDNNSVFVKKVNCPPPIYKLQKDSVKNDIPKNSFKEEQKDLALKHTEWRWRILEINNIEVIEISFKMPNKKRVFMNRHGEWKKRDIDPIYDKYVIEAYYYYSDV